MRTINSIAVLPLDNYSGDPNQEYFSDGMTDELTTDLATITALRVISRGSVMQYKGAHRPPTPKIAKALNVDAVVEGSVIRVGDKVRITVQLIDALNDKNLWAKNFERDSRDVLALQDELASTIAKEINVQLIAQFAEAVRLDPNFVLLNEVSAPGGIGGGASEAALARYERNYSGSRVRQEPDLVTGGMTNRLAELLRCR